jgi:ParB-like chromosome segregation protein Spo0J
MKVEAVPIDSISQDPANLRKHSDRNLSAIIASLRKFGQQHPVVIDSRGIILAGNGRYEAIKQLGWPTILAVRSDLSGSEATAYSIADNRTAELAEWHEVELAETLRALQSEGFDIEAAGYLDVEVDQLLAKLGNGELPPDADGKEYDESVADDVEMCICPKCSYEFPK